MSSAIRIEGYWVVSGTTFSPRAAEQATQIIFSEKHEPGEVCMHGRYKGKPSPSGWAKHDFSVPSDGSDLVSADSDILLTLEHCVSAYKKAGAQDIVLHFNISYSSQCNIQLSAPLVRRLAKLEVDVTMTCFTTDL